MSAQNRSIETLYIEPHSDGNYNFKPKPDAGHESLESDPSAFDRYLESVGSGWMTHRTGAKLDQIYSIDRLPTGFTAWAKKRSDTRVDKFTYGHPSGGHYRSIAEFIVHFIALMECEGDMAKMHETCKCILCHKKGKVTTTQKQTVAHENPPSATEASEEVHPTTANTFANGRSCSLLHERYFHPVDHLDVVWCEGLRLGPEVIEVGDLVRLLPTQESPTSQALGDSNSQQYLKISHIKMTVSHTGSMGTAFLYPSAGPPKFCALITMHGKMYTPLPAREMGEYERASFYRSDAIVPASEISNRVRAHGKIEPREVAQWLEANVNYNLDLEGTFKAHTHARLSTEAGNEYFMLEPFMENVQDQEF